MFCLAMAGFCVSQIDNSALSEDREHKKLKIDKHKTPLPWSRGLSVHFSRIDTLRDRFKGSIAFDQFQITSSTIVRAPILAGYTHARPLLS